MEELHDELGQHGALQNSICRLVAESTPVHWLAETFGKIHQFPSKLPMRQCDMLNSCGLVVTHPSHVFNISEVQTAYVKHLGGITSRARQQAVVEVLNVRIT